MADEEKQEPEGDAGEATDETADAVAAEATADEQAPADAEAAAEESPDEEPPEEKKPRRRRRRTAKAEQPEEVKQEDAEKEVEAEEAEAVEGEPPEEDEQARPRTGRRGGAAAAGRSRRATPARRSPDGEVTVRARAKYVRCAPRKARLVVDHIRGKDVGEARAILQHTTRAASRDVLKLLESAIANAENNHELVADELRVGKVYVDEGPTLKRYRPRALGRATRINKRTSHLTIELVAKE